MSSNRFRDRFIEESEREGTPINDKDSKFRADVCAYLEVQQEDA
jgi:hypothetical protein